MCATYASKGERFIDRTIRAGALKTTTSLNDVAGNTSVGLSPSLWKNVPIASIKADPLIGTYYFNDYTDRLGGGQQTLTGTSTTEISDWIQTEVDAGETAAAEINGGALRISSEGYLSQPNPSAESGLTVMYRATPFIPADTKDIWFEARIALTNIDTSGVPEDQFFIGLCNTITDALPFGTVDDTVDKVGFFHDENSFDSTLSFITAKTTVDEKTASAATGLVTGTFVKVGFHIGWVGSVQTVTPYINGVAGTVHNTAASVPTSGTGLGICYAAVSQGTSIAYMDVDWVSIAQLR